MAHEASSVHRLGERWAEPLKGGLSSRYSRAPGLKPRVFAGGAWPFLVGGVICLLNCDNERDLNLLNSQVSFGWPPAS